MPKLEALFLNYNQIVETAPLATLSGLRGLRLENNQIADLRSLAALTQLEGLYLQGNPVPHRACPVQPQSICQF